ncbi:MAG TPA: DinB family protein [Vicinamibacterales bacterium]
MNFTTLTLDELRSELDRTTADVRTAFGHLDGRQLNWRPDAASWSVAQCLEHLVNANREMCGAIERAADPGVSRTIWQRLPAWPRLWGRLMVTSLTPANRRKLQAPRAARPSASDIATAVVDRFVTGQQEVTALIRRFEGHDLDRLIMVSPFVRVISYSVLDALRVITAHERRHFEQAVRVTKTPGFPT